MCVCVCVYTCVCVCTRVSKVRTLVFSNVKINLGGRATAGGPLHQWQYFFWLHTLHESQMCTSSLYEM